MGTIISALENRKPILVMPRKSSLGEHRNDHQYSTAKRFLKYKYISVAFNNKEFIKTINNADDVIKSYKKMGEIEPSPQLIQTIRKFISS